MDKTIIGLTSQQVADRVDQGLVNEMPQRSGRTVAQILRANIFTRINAILTVLLIIVAATGSWVNCAFGLLIVANSVIGIIQELRAKATLDKLAVVGEVCPTIRRDGKVANYSRDQVVQDDIIELAPGDQVVVDGEVVEADVFEVDESLITGESDPVAKKVGDQLLSGSYCVSGAGAYRATKVGRNSYAAQLSESAARFSLIHSRLQAGINKILKVITWLLIPVGIATVIVQLSEEPSWQKAVLRMAGAIVPMVPEGLVLITATAFALGVIRLGRRNCLVQELPAIEGLARADVICIDKTGTLTSPGLQVESITELANIEKDEITEALAQLVQVDPHPNPSMKAIADLVGSPLQQWKLIERYPFSSDKKWSGAKFDQGQWILGAPDVLATGNVAQIAEEIGSTGFRVLLLARGEVSRCEAVALIAMKQTIRPEAKSTLDYFKSQNIEVKVISGDNPVSVAAVTAELGMSDTNPVNTKDLTDEELAKAVNTHQIFGRVRPDQKRKMVKALQDAGHCVAMTGDGVNDIMALKEADLGIAMGSGASATRSSAQIVLLDDKFSTLPHLVGEGRRVLGNIERVANLFLTKTIYSALLALLVVLARLKFPLLPIHVTITGWFTIGLPAFLLSLAPNNQRAKSGFVRRVLRFAVPSGAVVAIATFTTYLLARHFYPQEIGNLTITTATLACLIIAATWVLAIVARPYEWWKICLIIGAYAGYLLIFSFPWLHQFFFLDTSQTSLLILGAIIGVLAAGLIEALWWFRRWLDGRQLLARKSQLASA
uniref:HAD-IC family P-type ATPase n=1 Tax=Vaginimicrobium propionicum TaxID=1871034 RepID=UPI0009707076|nr:HAD-IC family P-type ATPase [Vaginimicrobium propionicum]